MEKEPINHLFPVSPEQQELARQVINEFQETQLIWLSGYLAGYLNYLQNTNPQKQNAAGNDGNHLSQPQQLAETSQNGFHNGKVSGKLNILFGTRTGNSRKAAEILYQKAIDTGISARLTDMSEYNVKDLKNETSLAIIVSTHGEGEPPLAAEEFYAFLHGTRAPQLPQLQYAVLALGDKSYTHFCKTGADIDSRLSQLGSTPLIQRQDCDIDFQTAALEWANSLIEKISHTSPTGVPVSPKTDIKLPEVYSRSNPFTAEILEKIQLNGKGADKETYHLELSLQGSGITYQPGDALGVYPENSDSLVLEMLSITGLYGEETVSIDNTSMPLREALKKHLEIGTLSREVIEKHNQHLKNPDLTNLLEDGNKLAEFTYGADFIDLLKKYPYPYGASDLVLVLRKLQARLYSISSAHVAYPDEVHITAGVLRYSSHDRDKNGTCSTFMSDQLQVGDKLRIFVESNETFRLPADSSAPVIMLGPGTGVAPFRAFTQHRAESGAKGKNWLFFGDRHFTTDFLYQSEWLSYKKRGVITNLSVAFSRDTRTKTYIQHKLKENAKEVISWIDEGAFIYVCGDMKRMARDIMLSLTEIISLEKNIDMDQAREIVRNLRKQKRYQEDVY